MYIFSMYIFSHLKKPPPASSVVISGSVGPLTLPLNIAGINPLRLAPVAGPGSLLAAVRRWILSAGLTPATVLNGFCSPGHCYTLKVIVV